MISFAIYVRKLINASLNNGPLQSFRSQNASKLSLWNLTENIGGTQQAEPCLIYFTYISQWKSIRIEGHATQMRGKSSKLSSSGFRRSHYAFNIMLRNGYLEIRTDEDLDTFSFSVSKSCLRKIRDFKHMFRISVCMPFSLVKRAAALPLTRLWHIWKSQIHLRCIHKPLWWSTYPVSRYIEDTSQHLACAMLMTRKTKISNV